MNRLLRNVLALLVGVLLGGYATWASAETIAALDGYKAEVYGEGIAYRAETAAAACLMASASSMVQTACGKKACVAPWSQIAGSCVGTHAPDAQFPGNTSIFATYSTAKYCPAGQNWTFVGPSSCTRPDCVAPDVRDPATGLCSPPACPASGTPYSSGWYPMGNSPSSSFPGVTCNGTCLVSFNGYAPAGQAIVGGQAQYYARGTWQYLGPSNTCSGGTATPAAQSSLPPDTCGANQYYGTINGKPVCINASTGQPDPTSPPPSPSTSQSQSTSVTNNDNSVTTTTTTINSDGSSTVTITTVYPNGDKDQTTTTTPPPGEDQTDDFCKKNPDSPMCQEIEAGSPAGTSDLYTPESRTVGNVLSDFRGKIQNAPFYSGASNFFNISVPGGACGGMNAQIAVGWGQSFNIDIDSVLCGSTAQIVYSVLGIGVMLAAAWVAFRIAIL